MRIDAYNQIAQLYGAQKTYNTQKANKTASMGKWYLNKNRHPRPRPKRQPITPFFR